MPVSLENLLDTMPQQKLSIVTGPWSEVEPSNKGHFFGEQSMHCLPFKPVTTATFFSFKGGRCGQVKLYFVRYWSISIYWAFFRNEKCNRWFAYSLSHLNRYCGPWQDMKLDHLSTVYTNLQHSGSRRSFHLFLTRQNVSRITARTWWMSNWRLTSDPMHELWVNNLLLTFQCSHDWNLQLVSPFGA